MKNIQTMKQRAQKGFTLIELMIVVAIIGILAALAIPAYQDYTIKSRVGEGASLSGGFKTAIDVYWSENGTLSNTGTNISSATLGLTSVAAEYVSDISIVLSGTRPNLEVALRDSTKLGSAANTCFTYIPTAPRGTSGNLQWTVSEVCAGGNDLPVKYLPKT